MGSTLHRLSSYAAHALREVASLASDHPSLAAPSVVTSAPSSICDAERTPLAQVGACVFRHRGWLPLLFLGVPLLVPGQMTATTWMMGVGLICAGEVWRLAGVAAAGGCTRRRSRDVYRLVTYGAFGWSRNPLYTGNFLIWTGFTVISGVLWFLPLMIAIFALEYSLIVGFEEGVLESTFGERYLAYKRMTPRWIPKSPATTNHGPLDWPQAWRSEVSTFLQYAVLSGLLVLKMRLIG